MNTKCKYCGKEIGGVVPAPLTCWTCYRKLRTDSAVVNNPNSSDMKLNTDKVTKECEVCRKVLPIDEFYKMGNAHNKMCKSCLNLHNSKRCLETFSPSQLHKMCNSGVTAEYLSKEWKKTRSTCQTMLNSLTKTNDAYKKIINGKNVYFMRKTDAEKLIKQKKAQSNQYSVNQNIKKVQESKLEMTNNSSVDIIFDHRPQGMIVEKIPGKGIYIKNVPIKDLGGLIEKFRVNMDPDFNFQISTHGDVSEIFLSEDQIFKWAYENIGSFLKDFEKQQDYSGNINNLGEEEW